jgi:uncharacterized cupin superfamily protein
VLDGEVTLRLGDEEHGLRPGDAITFAAAMPHQLENTGAAPACAVIVTVRGGLDQDLLRAGLRVPLAARGKVQEA